MSAADVRVPIVMLGEVNGQWTHLILRPAPSIFRRGHSIDGIGDLSWLLGELHGPDALEPEHFTGLYSRALGEVWEAARIENWLREHSTATAPEDDEDYHAWQRAIDSDRQDLDSDNFGVGLDSTEALRLLEVFSTSLDDIISPTVVEAMQSQSRIRDSDWVRLRFLSKYVYLLSTTFAGSYFQGPVSPEE